MASADESTKSAPPSATYSGSCHCNSFKYTVTHSPPLDDLSCEITECNCSICSRNGYLLTYVNDKKVTFEKGSLNDLTQYTFAPHRKIAHYFCPTCGTSCFAKSTTPDFYPDFLAINVRTFHDVDFKALNLKFVDGKSH